jgi:hypothetical protein
MPLARKILFPNFELSATGQKPCAQQLRRSLRFVGTAQCTFPNRRDTPAVAGQLGAHSAVPRDIGGEFRLPEFGPRRGGRGIATSVMPMPEAAMHEDHRPELREQEIRPTADLLCMQPIPETACMQQTQKYIYVGNAVKSVSARKPKNSWASKRHDLAMAA